MPSGDHETRQSGNSKRRTNAGRAGTRRYKPPVYMVKLTERREITPYRWTHSDDDDRR